MPARKLPDKDFVWTLNLAYAVGLLVTDGNLSNNGRTVVFRSSELQQIDTFKKCLGIENKTGQTKTQDKYGVRFSYRVQYGNVQFYKWLLKIGLYPRKTYTIGAVVIPDKFFRDFLRGHLDGDGSITTYQDNYNSYKDPSYIYTRLFIRFISASRSHMEWLRRKIIELVGVKGDFCELKPHKKGYVSIWQLKFMKKESIKLLRWMYYGGSEIPFLIRKRIKAELALALLEQEKRKLYTRLPSIGI